MMPSAEIVACQPKKQDWKDGDSEKQLRRAQIG